MDSSTQWKVSRRLYWRHYNRTLLQSELSSDFWRWDEITFHFENGDPPLRIIVAIVTTLEKLFKRDT